MPQQSVAFPEGRSRRLDGTWFGTYRYDHPKFDRQMGVVPFTMEFVESEDGSFAGWVEDDVSSGGTPGRGSIQGRRAGDDIRWLKRMPVWAWMVITPDGKRVMKTDPNRRHPTLSYRGRMSDDGTASGRWSFTGVIGFLSWMLTFGRGGGTWTLRRPSAID